MKKCVFFLLVLQLAKTQQITTNNVQPSAKQGNGTRFQLAGVISGSGIPLCTDANGNSTTSLCPGTVGNVFTVANGGTGAASFTLNGVLFGNNTAALGATAPGNQYQTLQAGVAGVPFWGPLNLGQAAAVTGVLPTVNLPLISLTSGVTGVLPAANITPINLASGANGGVSGILPTANMATVNLTSGVTGVLPVASGGSGVGLAQGVGGTKVQLAAGTTTPGNVPKYDANGALIDSGLTPTSTITPAALNTADYNFATQSPSSPVTLAIGNNTVIMTPVPLGVNGTDLNHVLYVAGTGTPEDCVITGGSGTSGAPTGSIILNCAGTHAAGYTVRSAAIGIPEAISTVCATGGGSIRIPSVGVVSVFSGWTVPSTCGISLRGSGMGQTYLQMVASTVGSPGVSGDWFVWNTGSGTGGAIDFGDLSINDITGVNHVGGSIVKALNRIVGNVSNLEIKNGYDTFVCNNCASNLNFHNVHFFGGHFGLSFIGTQTQANISDATISGGAAAISVNNTQTVGFYISNSLLDNTASGGNVNSSAIRFTEVGANAINEVNITGCDLESVGDGFEFTGNNTTYINNSVVITGNRINAGTYSIFATNKINGLHVVGNYLTVSGVSAGAFASVFASDVRDLTISNNRIQTQGNSLYLVQGGGTTSTNWTIKGNSQEVASIVLLTYAVALPNGMDKVTITDNDFSGIPTHVNAVTGLTNSRISGNVGLQLFAVLPSCAAGIEGSDATVTDSTTAVWGATVTGTGANHILTRCNGTNWTVVAK